MPAAIFDRTSAVRMADATTATVWADEDYDLVNDALEAVA
jgi:hypothetical protein